MAPGTPGPGPAAPTPAPGPGPTTGRTTRVRHPRSKGWKLLIWALVLIAVVIYVVHFRNEAQKSLAAVIPRRAPICRDAPPPPLDIEVPGKAGKNIRVSNNSMNNPLNMKFSPFSKNLGAEDSGHQATDGGTYARFATPEMGIAASRELLLSRGYRDLTTERALRRWSHNGYGAEVIRRAGISANQTIGSLTADQLDQAMGLMSYREGGVPLPDEPVSATESLNEGEQTKASPDDHSRDRITRFEVAMRGDCFPGFVAVPRFWKHWEKQAVSDEPDWHIQFWFSSWADPSPIYGPNNMPRFDFSPSNLWRIRGKGKIRYTMTVG